MRGKVFEWPELFPFVLWQLLPGSSPGHTQNHAVINDIVTVRSQSVVLQLDIFFPVHCFRKCKYALCDPVVCPCNREYVLRAHIIDAYPAGYDPAFAIRHCIIQIRNKRDRSRIGHALLVIIPQHPEIVVIQHTQNIFRCPLVCDHKMNPLVQQEIRYILARFFRHPQGSAPAPDLCSMASVHIVAAMPRDIPVIPAFPFRNFAIKGRIRRLYPFHTEIIKYRHQCPPGIPGFSNQSL